MDRTPNRFYAIVHADSAKAIIASRAFAIFQRLYMQHVLLENKSNAIEVYRFYRRECIITSQTC